MEGKWAILKSRIDDMVLMHPTAPFTYRSYAIIDKLNKIWESGDQISPARILFLNLNVGYSWTTMIHPLVGSTMVSRMKSNLESHMSEVKSLGEEEQVLLHLSTSHLMKVSTIPARVKADLYFVSLLWIAIGVLISLWVKASLESSTEITLSIVIGLLSYLYVVLINTHGSLVTFEYWRIIFYRSIGLTLLDNDLIAGHSLYDSLSFLDPLLTCVCR
jgi:hypothetical protein